MRASWCCPVVSAKFISLSTFLHCLAGSPLIKSLFAVFLLHHVPYPHILVCVYVLQCKMVCVTERGTLCVTVFVGVLVNVTDFHFSEETITCRAGAVCLCLCVCDCVSVWHLFCCLLCWKQVCFLVSLSVKVQISHVCHLCLTQDGAVHSFLCHPHFYAQGLFVSDSLLFLTEFSILTTLPLLTLSVSLHCCVLYLHVCV